MSSGACHHPDFVINCRMVGRQKRAPHNGALLQ